MQRQERWCNLMRVAAYSGVVVATLAAFSIQPVQAQEPIRIGLGMALTGPLAANGKSALLGMKIWEEDINKQGGLIGRPVKLVYYDDQSNPSTVPGLYAKLLDIDKVDLLMGHATNLIVAAMPLVIERKKLVMVLLALGSNSEFKYSR
ncbi:MAG TPA: ABC transporter substrate-binding protein, partial [Hyphomicrobiaceae bacterium]|nr:ABC transporter substrate-binding protein [Hyphomicrobiaceae bacterium]